MINDHLGKYGKYMVHLATKQMPCSQDVLKMNAAFSEPHKVIDSLFQNFVNVNPKYKPSIELEPLLQGRLWKAHLNFAWPMPFRVTTRSTDRDHATHYAYLEACDMFRSLGLISSKGEVINWRKVLLTVHILAQGSFERKPVVRFSTRMVDGLAQSMWRSSLDIGWPYGVHVIGHGVTQLAAEQMAAAMAFVKLKSQKLLDGENMTIKRIMTVRIHQTNEQDTDYELWVDASIKGFGAHLTCKAHSEDGSGSTCSTRWFHEQWPDTMRRRYIDAKCFSSVTEFYALVSAIFTWKKKLQSRSVLILTDSMHSVSAINRGIVVNIDCSHPNDLFQNLYKTLQDTCGHYDIHLQCQHVSRWRNQAADSLSRLDTVRFYKLVPNAFPVAKKSKKLFFILPKASDIKTEFQTKI